MPFGIDNLQKAIQLHFDVTFLGTFIFQCVAAHT